MSQATSIQWTDFSVNPFRARGAEGSEYEGRKGHYCEKVSAGCTHCYASTLQHRFGMPQFDHRNRKHVELYLDGLKLLDVLRRRKPTKYFWCDMTDMFAEFYPDEWIDQCLRTMAQTPWHTHIILTKRIARARDYFRAREGKPFAGQVWPFPNVWLLTSCENQATANERIPILLDTPAIVRGISAEPLLGPIDICQAVRAWRFQNSGAFNSTFFGDVLHWVIVGGESGGQARAFDIQWAYAIIAQCKAAGVACFVKQLGRHPFAGARRGTSFEIRLLDHKGGDWDEWDPDLRVREFPNERIT